MEQVMRNVVRVGFFRADSCDNPDCKRGNCYNFLFVAVHKHNKVLGIVQGKLAIVPIFDEYNYTYWTAAN